MERFVIIVNSWKPLTIITKSSILDAAAVLDPPLKLTGQLNAVANTLTEQSSTKLIANSQSYVTWGLREGHFFLITFIAETTISVKNQSHYLLFCYQSQLPCFTVKICQLDSKYLNWSSCACVFQLFSIMGTKFVWLILFFNYEGGFSRWDIFLVYVPKELKKWLQILVKKDGRAGFS